MTKVLLYKFAQSAVLLTFTIFISDIRRKEGSRPLVDELLVLLMKLCYLIPVSVFAYSIYRLASVSILGYLSIGLTFAGTTLVLKAKLDLGDYHVWTGYGKEETRLVVRGVYRWIRHPIYAGIFLFILGAMLVTVPGTPWFLLIPFFISLTYITAFLIYASIKETEFLKKKFGDEFIQYYKRVHPFVPVNKYEE
jgi:protein-S-isoprenylcysteine O-methyltransferase Ste14